MFVKKYKWPGGQMSNHTVDWSYMWTVTNRDTEAPLQKTCTKTKIKRPLRFLLEPDGKNGRFCNAFYFFPHSLCCFDRFLTDVVRCVLDAGWRAFQYVFSSPPGRMLRVSASIHHWQTALFQLRNASDYSKYLSCNFLGILGNFFFVPINTLQSARLLDGCFLSQVRWTAPVLHK